MTFLSQLSCAAQSASSAWLQFVLAHNAARKNELYVFLEGGLDVAFYSDAFARLLPDRADIKQFKCGNRDGVLATRDRIKQTHPQCDKCLYFIDKDYVDLLSQPTSSPNSDIYRTSWYSIENYLVNTQAFKVVWTQLWLLSSADDRYQKIVVKFEDSIKQFHAHMTTITAWIILAMKNGEKPNIGSLKLQRIIDIDEDLVVTPKPDLITLLCNETGCIFRPSPDVIRQESEALAKLNAKTYIRGKFEMWFLCEFLTKVSAALRAAGKGKFAPDGSIQTSHQSVAIAIISKLPVPQDLEAFLEASRWRLETEHLCVR